MSADGGWSLRLVSEPLAWETSVVRCFTGLHVLLGTVCKLLKPSRNRVPTANLASEHKADTFCATATALNHPVPWKWPQRTCQEGSRTRARGSRGVGGAAAPASSLSF